MADDDDDTEDSTVDGHVPDQVDGDGEAEETHDWTGEGSGTWIPGQGVFVDHAAIMDIIIQHLSYPGEPLTLGHTSEVLNRIR